MRSAGVVVVVALGAVAACAGGSPPGEAARFTERPVTVGRGTPWELPGTLSTPSGEGPWPGLVLVHGSGPNDRDETLGPNKPFRDLGRGLAAKGVVVLRYEKRTRQYPGAAAGVSTVKEETVDDAVAGAGLLRATAGVDSARVFVLGHSQGALLIGRIGAADPAIAGFVALAAPARPLTEIMREQVRYLARVQSGDGGHNAEIEAALAGIEAVAARIDDPALSPSTPAGELLGAPGSWWLDLRGFDPPAAAAALQRPLLVLQGGRDYQVTMVDFERWRQALAGRTDVTLRAFPDLNHHFIAGSGPSTPAEYQRPGRVATEVVEEIAAFLHAPR